MGCSCAEYTKIRQTGKDLGNLRKANSTHFHDPRTHHNVTRSPDRKSPILFHQRESSAWVSSKTSHKGTLGVQGAGEGSQKERLEGISLFLTSGYISGSTVTGPGCLWPSGNENLSGVRGARSHRAGGPDNDEERVALPSCPSLTAPITLQIPQDQITSFLSCPYIWNSHKDSNKKRGTLRQPSAGVPRRSKSCESPLRPVDSLHLCLQFSGDQYFLMCSLLEMSVSFLHTKEEKSTFPSILLEPKIAHIISPKQLHSVPQP